MPPLVYDVLQPNATDRFLKDIFSFAPPDRSVDVLSRRQDLIHKLSFNETELFEAEFANDECATLKEILTGFKMSFEMVNNSLIQIDNIGGPYPCNHLHKYHFQLLKGFGAAFENRTQNDDPYLAYAFEISLLFSLKPASEIFSNIASGLIVNRFGHRKPLVIGCLSTFFATIGFACSPWYWMLAVTRVIQAIGSSLSVVAGLALLTCVFKNDAERSRANSLAYDGLTLGLLLGMPFGSTLYNFSGRQTPFLILSLFVLIDLLLRCFYIDSSDSKLEPPHADRSAKDAIKETKSIYGNLLSNTDVNIALITSLVINGALGALMSSSPAYLLDE